MRQLLLPTAVAFLLGLSVGGYAFMDREGVGSPVEASGEPAPSRRLIAAAPAPSESERVAGDSVPDAKSPAAEAAQGALLDIELGTMSLDERFAVVLARWARLEEQVRVLNERIFRLERERLAVQRSEPEPEPLERETLPVDTPDNRREALVSAGVSEPQAEEIVWRQSELALRRLELQDQATREGWFRTERYYQELRAMNADDLDVRNEIGEAAYDRFLYQTGEPNRVRIGTVFQGSVGEGAGLQPGDIIESYGGRRILDFSDLRTATTSGARDELVPVIVRRDGAVFDTWMARGPIGVSLDTASVAPEP